MSAIIREFFKLYGPLVLGFLLVSLWFLNAQEEGYVELVSERQVIITKLAVQALDRKLSEQAQDIRFLARVVANSSDLQGNRSRRQLENMFTDFALNRPYYFQIRYLNARGKELVRVDRSFAGPVIAPTSAMQDKSGRYYFSKAMEAEKDEVYISDLDLNIEFGSIETPYRPTLRYGSPVVDSNWNKRGVVVINYEGNALFDELKRVASAGDGSIMLCNGEGYWLLGLNAADEWGQLLPGGEELTMGNRYPAAWKAISGAQRAQVLTEDGLFTSDTVNVSPGNILTSVPQGFIANGTQWKVISFIPRSELGIPWRMIFIVLVWLALITLGAGCWFLASNRVAQAEVEVRLRENEERTLAISQSSQDAIVMIDHKSRIVHWNPSAERLFGYRKGEVMGLNLHSILAPESERPLARTGMERFALSGRGSVIDTVVEQDGIRKDGSRVPVELAISKFRFKNEWYAVGSMRDMTRRKKNELELLRSEETSRALLNATTESAMLLESNGRIVAINELGASRLGGTVDEVVGRNAYDLIEPELANKRESMLRKVRETGEPVAFEDYRNGRWMLVNVYPVKQDGVVSRIAVYARDITEQREAEAALKRSEQRFRDVSESVGEYIWETDIEGRFKFVTDDVVQVLGYTAQELIGTMPHDMIPENDMEEYGRSRIVRLKDRQPFNNYECRNVTKDGRIIWVQINGVPYFDDDGNFMGYRGAAMGITDRKEAEEAVKASEGKLRALAESAYDAIVMIDSNGVISFWNEAAVKLFGYSEAEALGRNSHALLATDDDREKAEHGMYQFAMTGVGPAVGRVTEVIATHKSGVHLPVERSISSFHLGGQWYAVATIRDITERKATEAKLRELATTDGLTGLNNRRRFMELLEQEYQRCSRYPRPLAMLMIDIDFFKKVNDDHGHDVGDEVLRSLSSIAEQALRGADVLGRLGGEEFGVILPETDESSACEVAERLRRSVEETPITTNVGTLNITVSVGVTTLLDEDTSTKPFLKRADVALYDAKQGGRNRVAFG